MRIAKKGECWQLNGNFKGSVQEKRESDQLERLITINRSLMQAAESSKKSLVLGTWWKRDLGTSEYCAVASARGMSEEG